MKKNLLIFLAIITILVTLSCFFIGCNGTDEIVDPVFTGITISDEIKKDNNVENTSVVSENNNIRYSGDYKGKYSEADINSPFNDNKIEDKIKEKYPTDNKSTDTYYTTLNKDIYATFHFTNPSKMGFAYLKVNGKKYTYYDFEAGSDPENIIIKFNTGDQGGYQTITLEEVIYLNEKTESKKLKIKENNIAKIGVAFTQDVTSVVENEVIGINDYSAKVTIKDDNGAIERDKGQMQAILYNGEAIIKTQDLVVGANDVKFDGLEKNTLYQVAIVAVYDNLTGHGVAANILYKKAFVTDSYVLFDNINISKNTITWDLVWSDKANVKEIKETVIISGDTQIQISGNIGEELVAGTEYTLITTYIKDGKEENIMLTFTTLPFDKPIYQITNVKTTKDSVSFSIEKADIDNIGEISKIELLHGEDDPIVAKLNTIRKFKGLQANTTYTLKVTYQYDRKDGEGVVYESVKQDIKTIEGTALTEPTYELTLGTVTNNSISFELVKTDVDEIGNIENIQLLHGEDEPITITDINARKFENLLSNNEYTIRVNYKYDLADGEGEIKKYVDLKATTLSLNKPTITLKATKSTVNSIDFSVDVVDADNTAEIKKIELLHGEDAPIVASSILSRSFTDLLSNQTYKLKLTYEYDLNDGHDKYTNSVEIDVQTKEYKTPTLSAEITNTTYDSIKLSYTKTDEDNLLSIDAIQIKDSQGKIVKVLNNGEKVFDELLSNNAYTVILKYSYDKLDGKGKQNKEIELQASTLAYTVPKITINAVPDYLSINYEVVFEDEFKLMKLSKIVLSIVDLGELYESTSLKGSFNEVLADTNYEIAATFTYDLNDGKGIQTITETTNVKTLKFDMPTYEAKITTASKDSVAFSWTENDPYNLLRIKTIELLNETNKVVQTGNVNTREFNNLLSNHIYKVKVVYEYSLLDMNDVQTDAYILETKTQAYEVPTIEITNVTSTISSIEFKLNKVDNDNICVINKIEAQSIHGNIAGNVNSNTITGLLSNTEYTLSIEYSYDMHDGQPIKTLTKTQVIKTLENVNGIPVYNIIDVMQDYSNVQFEISVDDPQARGTITNIQLIKDDIVLKTEAAETRSFTGLLSNSSYLIKLNYKYNLNDGQGDKESYVSYTFNTNAYQEPTFNMQVESINFNKQDIIANISINKGKDFDLLLNNISYKLFIGEREIKSVDLGKEIGSQLVLNNLLSGTTYRLVATYSFDYKDGKEIITKTKDITFTTKTFIKPMLTLQSVETTSTQVKLTINLINPQVDNYKVSNLAFHLSDKEGKKIEGVKVGNEIKFNNLLSNNVYSVSIAYTYDLNDGLGEKTLNVNEEVSTKAIEEKVVTITNISSTVDEIHFNVQIPSMEAAATLELQKVELFKEGQLVATDAGEHYFNNLLSNTNYVIIATYTIDLNDGKGTLTKTVRANVKTETMPEPIVSILDVSTTPHSIAFVIQNYNNTEISKIELLNINGELVQETTVEELIFKDVYSSTKYIIKVSYKYDLNDGKGIQTKSITKEAITLEDKKIPTYNITADIITYDSISYNINVEDESNISTIVKIELFNQNGDCFVANNVGIRQFNELLSNNNYEIKLTYAYDINDGKGVQYKTKSISVKTKAYNVPDFTIKANSSYDNIQYEILENDEFNLGNVKKTTISTQGYYYEILEATKGEFHLIDNTNFELQVIYEYNLNDGKGVQIITKKQMIKTLEYEDPTIDIVISEIGYDYFDFILNKNDPNKFIHIDRIELYDSEGNTEKDVIIEHRSYDLDLLKKVRATRALSNTTYEIVVEYFSETDYTRREVSKTVTTLKHDVPSVDITNLSSTSNSINFDLAIIDNDNIGEIYSITLTEGENNRRYIDNNVRTITELKANTEYTLEVVYNYKFDEFDPNYPLEIRAIKTISTKENIEGIPSYSIEILELQYTNASYRIIKNDPQNLGKINSIELLQNNEVVKVLDEQTLNITNLKSNNNYAVRVNYTYNLNDNNGDISANSLYYFNTKAYEEPKPNINIQWDMRSELYMSYNCALDELILSKTYNLYCGENLIQSGNWEYNFYIPQPLNNSEYKFEFIYTYDLFDGNGVITKKISKTCYTRKVRDPEVYFHSITSTNSEILVFYGLATFDIEYYKSSNIEGQVYLENELVGIGLLEAGRIRFKGLLSNKEYLTKLIYTYDLNDGKGIQTIEIPHTIKTKEIKAKEIGVNELNVTTNSIEFNLYVPKIEKPGKLEIDKIELLKEGEIVAVDDGSHKFSNLYTNTQYDLKLTYKRNVNDGNGDVLMEKIVKVQTMAIKEPTFEIIGIKSTQNSISFMIDKDINETNATIQNIVLLNSEGQEIRETQESSLNFSGLNSNNNYTIKLLYQYDLRDGKGIQNKFITANVKTLEDVNIPIYNVIQDTITYDSISFKIDKYDPQGNTKIDKIELLHNGDNSIVLSDNNLRVFKNLLSNNEYTIKVTYSYESSAANEIVSNSVELKIRTKEYMIPNVIINVKYYDYNSLYYVIEENDKYNLGNIERVELINTKTSEKLIKDANTREIHDLKANTIYKLNIVYKYNLMDGMSDIIKEESILIKTKSYNKPDLELLFKNLDKGHVYFDILFNDPNSMIAINKIELYNQNIKIDEVKNLEERSFDKLELNKEYTIKLSYKYDLLDGEGEQIIEKTLEFKTPNISVQAPTMDVKIVEVGTNYIGYIINENDPSDLGEFAFSYIYKDNQFDSIDIVNNDTTITGLHSDTKYRIEFNYVYNMWDGKGDKILTKTFDVETLKAINFGIKDIYSDSVQLSFSVCEGIEIHNFKYKVISENATVESHSINGFIDGLKPNTHYTVVASVSFSQYYNHREDFTVEFTTKAEDNKYIDITINNISDIGAEYIINTFETKDIIVDIESIGLSSKYGSVSIFDTNILKNLIPNTVYDLCVNYRVNQNKTGEIHKEFTTKGITPTLNIDYLGTNSVEFNISLANSNSNIKETEIIVKDLNAIIHREPYCTSYVISNLKPNTKYTVDIYYYFNSEQFVISKEFTTKAELDDNPYVEINIFDVFDSVSYSITEKDPTAIGEITKIELLHGQDLPIDLGLENLGTINKYVNGDEYQIKVTYSYNNGELVTKEFIRKFVIDKMVPSISLVVNTIKGPSGVITYDEIIKNDNNFNITKHIELLDADSNLIGENNQGMFVGLLNNTQYTVRLRYSYDLNDGLGVQNKEELYPIKTCTKYTPYVFIDVYNIGLTDFCYSIDSNDVIIQKVELWSNGQLVRDLGSNQVLDQKSHIKDLQVNTEYNLKIKYSYNLGDGKEYNEVCEEKIKTLYLNELRKDMAWFRLNKQGGFDYSTRFYMSRNSNLSYNINNVKVSLGNEIIYAKIKDNCITIENAQVNKTYLLEVDYTVTTVYRNQPYNTIKTFEIYTYMPEARILYEINDLTNNHCIINILDFNETVDLYYDYSFVTGQLIHDNVIEDINVFQVDQFEFNDLNADTYYTFIYDIKYPLNNGEVYQVIHEEIKFKTPKKDVVEPKFVNFATTDDSVTFGLEQFSTGDVVIKDISIFRGLDKAINIDVRERVVNNLLPNTEYLLKIDYICNNGKNYINKSIVKTFKTQPQPIEELINGDIIIGNKTHNNVEFNVDFIKGQDLVTIEDIQLLKGVDIVNKGNININNFNNLIPNTDYTIKVIYSYISEGTSIKKEIIKNFRTNNIPTPTIAIQDKTPGIITWEFSIIEDDPYNIGSLVRISFYNANPQINVVDGVINISKLRDNTSYEIIMLYQYDLQDGEGIHNIEIIKSIKTMPTVETVLNYVVKSYDKHIENHVLSTIKLESNLRYDKQLGNNNITAYNINFKMGLDLISSLKTGYGNNYLDFIINENGTELLKFVYINDKSLTTAELGTSYKDLPYKNDYAYVRFKGTLYKIIIPNIALLIRNRVSIYCEHNNNIDAESFIKGKDQDILDTLRMNFTPILTTVFNLLVKETALDEQEGTASFMIPIRMVQGEALYEVINGVSADLQPIFEKLGFTESFIDFISRVLPTIDIRIDLSNLKQKPTLNMGIRIGEDNANIEIETAPGRGIYIYTPTINDKMNFNFVLGSDAGAPINFTENEIKQSLETNFVNYHLDGRINIKKTLQFTLPFNGQKLTLGTGEYVWNIDLDFNPFIALKYDLHNCYSTESKVYQLLKIIKQEKENAIKFIDIAIRKINQIEPIILLNIKAERDKVLGSLVLGNAMSVKNIDLVSLIDAIIPNAFKSMDIPNIQMNKKGIVTWKAVSSFDGAVIADSLEDYDIRLYRSYDGYQNAQEIMLDNSLISYNPDTKEFTYNHLDRGEELRIMAKSQIFNGATYNQGRIAYMSRIPKSQADRDQEWHEQEEQRDLTLKKWKLFLQNVHLCVTTTNMETNIEMNIKPYYVPLKDVDGRIDNLQLLFGIEQLTIKDKKIQLMGLKLKTEYVSGEPVQDGIDLYIDFYLDSYSFGTATLQR